MTTTTLWCAGAGLWGGAAAFLVVAIARGYRELQARRRAREWKERWDR